jgi:hypothetical protein
MGSRGKQAAIKRQLLLSDIEPTEVIGPRPRLRLHEVVSAVGYAIFFLVMGIVFCIVAVLGVGYAVNAHEPTYWGTFTADGCVPSGKGCQSVGTWVSDDKSMVKKHIALDGLMGSDDSVRASYTPTGFNNDAENNIVHTAFWGTARYWLPWVLCVLVAAFVAERTHLLRRRRRGAERRAHPSHLAGSPDS